jgi:hypothetical protein
LLKARTPRIVQSPQQMPLTGHLIVASHRHTNKLRLSQALPGLQHSIRARLFQ